MRDLAKQELVACGNWKRRDVMISDAAMGGARPTEAQKRWLAEVFGSEVWEELCGRAEFRSALETSVDLARRVGLRYLAEKEVYQRKCSID